MFGMPHCTMTGNLELRVAGMTDQTTDLFVECQRDVTVLAHLDVAALRTQQRRAKATTIEQQYHLPLGVHGLANGVRKWSTEGTKSTLGLLALEIDNSDNRHRLVGHPLGKRQQFVPARLRRVPALQRRRRGAENDRNLLEFGTFDRDVARMVTRRVLLLEGGLVLFIKDDQPEIVARGKQGAASSDNDLDLTGGNSLPVPVALDIGQVAVENRDVIETLAEPLNGLRGQTDLGDQNDCLSAAGDHLGDGL